MKAFERKSSYVEKTLERNDLDGLNWPRKSHLSLPSMTNHK